MTKGDFPPQHKDVLGETRLRVDGKRLRFSGHALIRLNKREVTQEEVKQVLRRGRRQTEKDKFEGGQWRYAITGKTIDGKRLRIAVVLMADGPLVVVTVIDLDRED